MIMAVHPPQAPNPFAALATPPHSRKRHAAEPIPFSFSPESPHVDKRRRPNLANGLSSLSLESHQHQQLDPTTANGLLEEISSEGSTSPTRYKREVSVEEIPDHRPFWSIPSHATTSHSSASSSTSDDGDSDATYRQLKRPKSKRKHEHAQQPDSISCPTEERAPVMNPDLGVQDVTHLSPGRPGKRRGYEEDTTACPLRKRRREGAGGMDLDMEEEEEEEEIEEIPRESRPRTRTEWYEPEKDRIVITSIGSPDSSRSSSRSPSPTRRNLAQPGQQGFTLNPSLLTHLLNSTRDNLFPGQHKPEKGLVLYRPIGIDPEVVRTWQGDPAIGGSMETDEGRFEEIDDDEIAGPGDMEVDDAEPMDMS